MADEQTVIHARADWELVEALPATHANQFACQLGLTSGDMPIPDGIYLGIGATVPPVILGEEDRQRRAEELKSIAVQPVCKLFMSRERAVELIGVLQTTVGQYDRALEQIKSAAHG